MRSPYVRLMASIILRCKGRVLMQHRAQDRRIAPGKWCVPGGHIEPDEMRTPAKAALRELYEETGIAKERLSSFGLRYVIMSTRPGELCLHFEYAAEMDEERGLALNGEGTLNWLAPEEILPLDLTRTMRAVFGHYLSFADDGIVRMGFLDGPATEWIQTDAPRDAGFRPAAGIIARCKDRLLLLHRPNHRLIAPGMWANVGGHMEAEELNDPAATALREFQEETAIPPDALDDIAFRSAMLVAKPNEFSMLYGYSATLSSEIDVPDSDEDGEFRWIGELDVAALPMTPAMKAIALVDAGREEAPQVGLALGEEVRRRVVRGWL